MRKFTIRKAWPAARGASIILLFSGFPVSAELPDLIVNRSRLASSIELKEQFFSATDCAVVEGCVKAGGNRKLILFEVAFANVGKADLVIGSPAANPGLFEQSPCHGHAHMKGVGSYELLRADGGSVAAARKQAFCLMDTVPYTTTAGPSRGYNCENQGITAGWEDVYSKGLDCQWLDVTGLPGGTYTLKVSVNPEHLFAEANYANNSASVTVQIPGAPASAPPKVQPAKKAPPKAKKPKKSKRGRHLGWYKNGKA